MTKTEIKQVTNIEDLLPLFNEYQIFYKQSPTQDRNLNFLQDIIQNKNGIYHVTHLDNKPVAFTGVYFSYSSVSAQKIAIINDLFVLDEYRKQGIGRKLMTYTIEYLKSIDISQIRWCTKQDNFEAQEFYKEFANSSKWIHYDLIVNKL